LQTFTKNKVKVIALPSKGSKSLMINKTSLLHDYRYQQVGITNDCLNFLPPFYFYENIN